MKGAKKLAFCPNNVYFLLGRCNMSEFDDNDFDDNDTVLGFENKAGAGISPGQRTGFTEELFVLPKGMKLKETQEISSNDERDRENEPVGIEEQAGEDRVVQEEPLDIPVEDFNGLSEEIDATAETHRANSTGGGTAEREVLSEALRELIAKVNSLNEELSEERNRKIRLAADMENLKKRSAKNQEMAVNRARTDVLVEFLPVVDHLEMALAHVEESTSIEALKEGVLMVLKQFANTLTRFGVESVDALGQTFDPNFHEAMAQEESQVYDSGVVISQWQKGYKLGEMLIRPARVVVSRGPGPGEDGGGTPEGTGSDREG